MTSMLINIVTFIRSICRCADIFIRRKNFNRIYRENFAPRFFRSCCKACTKRYVVKESLIKAFTLPCARVEFEVARLMTCHTRLKR